jgi:hypothetical protein
MHAMARQTFRALDWYPPCTRHTSHPPGRYLGRSSSIVASWYRYHRGTFQKKKVWNKLHAGDSRSPFFSSNHFPHLKKKSHYPGILVQPRFRSVTAIPILLLILVPRGRSWALCRTTTIIVGPRNSTLGRGLVFLSISSSSFFFFADCLPARLPFGPTLYHTERRLLARNQTRGNPDEREKHRSHDCPTRSIGRRRRPRTSIQKFTVRGTANFTSKSEIPRHTEPRTAQPFTCHSLPTHLPTHFPTNIPGLVDSASEPTHPCHPVQLRVLDRPQTLNTCFLTCNPTPFSAGSQYRPSQLFASSIFLLPGGASFLFPHLLHPICTA